MQNAGNNIPLSKQVQYFKSTKAQLVTKLGSRATHLLLSRSVFLFSVGSNDLFVFATAQASAHNNKSAADQQRDVATLYASLISNYSATITVSMHSYVFRTHVADRSNQEDRYIHYIHHSCTAGAAHHGREEVRHHQRGAARLRPRGAAVRRDEDGRVLGRPERARVGPGRRPRGPARQPRLPPAGLHLLARRLLRPVDGHLRRPGGVGVHGRRRRVLRGREVRRRGGLPAQRHGVQQPRPARVLGQGAPLPARGDAHRAKLLRQPPGPIHSAHQLQAAGFHQFMNYDDLHMDRTKENHRTSSIYTGPILNYYHLINLFSNLQVYTYSIFNVYGTLCNNNMKVFLT
jgi:hypothetical protein